MTYNADNYDDRSQELRKELKEHKSTEVVQQRDNIQRALQVFYYNSEIYKDILNEIKDRVTHSENIYSIIDKDEDRFIQNTQNYFSSVYSLYNQTQKLQNQLYCVNNNTNKCTPECGCEGYEDYTDICNKYSIKEKGAFMIRLRVRLNKISSPRLLGHSEYNLIDIKLNKGVVVRGEKFCDIIDNGLAENYVLDKNKSDLSLLNEVETYEETIDNFYGEIFSDISQKYKDELQERDNIIDNYN